MPTKAEVAEHQGLEEEMIKMKMFSTNTSETELEGLDNKAKLIILRNKEKEISFQEANKKMDRGSNSSILPAPKPIGQNVERFGLDEYINFDKARNEIHMEIPWEVLINPEKNRLLGKRK